MGSEFLISDRESPATVPENTGLYADETLSVVMRFHSAARLPFLEEALFSLAVQTWADLSVAVAVQNGSDQLIQEINRIARHQPWLEGTNVQIFPVRVESGVDGRSRLLNEGIRRATGRYLAFLDDDDVVYQHAYSTLIGRLRATNAALAVGGSRVAKMRRASSHWYVVGKEAYFTWGRAQEDLFIDNFIPIHSYVIDRTRITPEHLYFDESLSLLEDYDLLLRLAVTYDFDFRAIGVPVCEYRVRLDGSNSIAFRDDTLVVTPMLQQARQEIELRKEGLLSTLSPAKRSRFRRQPSEPSAPGQENPEHFVFKAARKLHAFFTRHPWLENRCSRMAHSLWRSYKQARKFYSGISASGKVPGISH